MLVGGLGIIVVKTTYYYALLGSNVVRYDIMFNIVDNAAFIFQSPSCFELNFSAWSTWRS